MLTSFKLKDQPRDFFDDKIIVSNPPWSLATLKQFVKLLKALRCPFLVLTKRDTSTRQYFTDVFGVKSNRKVQHSKRHRAK